MQACLSPARIESIPVTVKRVREGQSLTVKLFQKLLGLMAAVIIQRNNFWPAAHETLALVAQNHRVFPRGNPFRMIKVP